MHVGFWKEPRSTIYKNCSYRVGALSQFVSEIEEVTGLTDLQNKVQSRLPWYSASVDSTYLTGKRVFIFGDGSHVIAAAKIAADEIGFELLAWAVLIERWLAL